MFGFDHRKSRPTTNRLMDMMADGLLDAQTVVDMALGWMSEHDVHQMMLANDLVEDEAEEEEEEWTPENADFNDKGSIHHY